MTKLLGLYSKRSNLVLGFHGCDLSTTESVISKNIGLEPSKNEYDWLGHGMYFWENNYYRALEWANNSKRITTPSVIGAVIDLGYCMDLMDSEFLPELENAYKVLEESMAMLNLPMPTNNGATPDNLLRNLDCAVIQMAHTINEAKNGNDDKVVSYDSVRGVFWEGRYLYPNAFFKEKNHIQICVRNPNCIKGYFLPREVDKKFIIP